MENRPLDFLNFCKDKKVVVINKNKLEIKGILVSFDIHINLVLKDAELYDRDKTIKKKDIFLRGDDIVLVYQDKK